MSPRWEQSGERDLAVNDWHRHAFDDECIAFDLDLAGVCRRCYQTLYLIESTRAEIKSTRWLHALSEQMHPSPPAFLIKYASDGLGEFQQFDAFLVLSHTTRQVLAGGRVELEETLRSIRRAHADRECRYTSRSSVAA